MYRARSCVQFWTTRFLCIILDSFVLRTTQSFFIRFKLKLSPAIENMLKKFTDFWKVEFLDFKTWKDSVKKSHLKNPGFWIGFLRQKIYLFVVCKRYFFDLLHFLQDLVHRMRPTGHGSPGKRVSNLQNKTVQNYVQKRSVQICTQLPVYLLFKQRENIRFVKSVHL